MAEGGGSILYFASDLLNVPQPITPPLQCLSFPWISPGLQAPGSHSKAVLRWKVSHRGGFSGYQGFFPPAGVGQLAQDIAARPRASLAGRVDLTLGLPAVSPVQIKGLSTPWGIPTHGLGNLVLRLPLSFLLLGKRGVGWPSPRLWVGLAPNREEATL